MKDEKEMLRCEECDTILKTGIPDQDSRGYIWCRNCGLVYEPGHPMGHNKSDLIRYAIYEGLQNSIDDIKNICDINNLRDARLIIAKMVLNK
jgi:transcription elongation factor Elf1